MLVDLDRTQQLGQPRRQSVVILGSTGSIGTAALEVIQNNPECLSVFGLVANRNVTLLAEQIRRYQPTVVVLASAEAEKELRALGPFDPKTQIFSGAAAVESLVTSTAVDTVLAAIVGVAGLASVLAACRHGKRVLLANKESLICGGNIVADAMAAGRARLIPVDSEHSAIFQALLGYSMSEVSRLILTASGGPFRNATARELAAVRPADALNHPTWKMGPKISIDSATLVNKALELIEAHWLFGFSEERIEVLIHPQSIVHSLVEYRDGTQLAQLSVPDMKGAIGFALAYPGPRLENLMPRLNLAKSGRLDFAELDQVRFPAVSVARECLRTGGRASAVFSLANEVAVEAFLNGNLAFDRIVPLSQEVVASLSGPAFRELSELYEAQVRVREISQRLIATSKAA